MKVAFDSVAFARPDVGGVARYFATLARELSFEPGVKIKVFSPFYRNKYAHSMCNRLITGLFVPTLQNTGLLVETASRYVSELQMRMGSCDVVHETGYTMKPCPIEAKARVITIHDMIHELFPMPGSQKITFLKRRAVERADHILCVSRQTQADLIRLFDVLPSKTSVTYLGVEKARNYSNATPPLMGGLGKPYLLYVGGRGGAHKNFAGFLRAVASSGILKKGVDTICFGGGPFNDFERELIISLGFGSGQVRQVSGSDESMGAYYTNAAAFVYPSIYEGFGIPPLEAMSMGCPVIASNKGAIPEVVGSAARLCCATDIAELAEAIETVVFDSAVKEGLVAEGYLRSSLFTWKKCAEETLHAYRSVM